MKQRQENLRIYFIYAFFILFFFSLVTRIAYLQIVQKDLFKKLAQNQHLKIIPLKGERGRIFDRKGRILATNLNVYSIYADPKLIDEKIRTAKALASILNLDNKEVLTKLRKKSRFVWIKRKITPDQKTNIEKIKLKGIGFIKDRMRFYPQGRLLAHTLGGVNIDNEGIEGIELFYDRYLRGKDGLVSVVSDSACNSLFFSPRILKPQRGLDIFLTIDAQIQYWAETYLKETIEEYSAKGGSVVVVQPMTGEILALANCPSFDPNYISSTPQRFIRNIAVTDIFEPGSVFKIATLVAAVDRKPFSLEDRIYCEKGNFKIPGSVLHDWKPYGDLSLKEVFKKSSNIGVAKIATTLGASILYEYIKKLGFGQKTGIDLPGESSSLLKHPRAWSKTSSYIIPIGQEIGITILQLARSMCVITNGGYLVKPHLGKRLVGEYGFVKEAGVQKAKVFASSVASTVKDILIEVVEDGTGRLAKIEDLHVGGKTGTAQKFDLKLGRYSPNAYRASFAGFIEKQGSYFVISVSIDEPKKSHFGGVVAAPLFKKIAQKVIKYMWLEKEIAKIR